jgi:hypothetical protein
MTPHPKGAGGCWHGLCSQLQMLLLQQHAARQHAQAFVSESGDDGSSDCTGCSMCQQQQLPP